MHMNNFTKKLLNMYIFLPRIFSLRKGHKVQKPKQFQVVFFEEMVILLLFSICDFGSSKGTYNAEIDRLLVLSVVSHFCMLRDVSLFMQWFSKGTSG